MPSRPQQERALAIYVKSSADQTTQCVMLADMADLLNEREEESRHFIRRPLYPHQVIQKKKKNLTRKGMPLLTFPFNTKYDKHVRNFLDVKRLHAENDNLCLGEFSKSLTNMAYPWYTIFATKTYQTVVFSCGRQVYSS